MSGWDYLAKLKQEEKSAHQRERYAGKDVSDDEAAEMLLELCGLQEGLSDWEVDFTDKLVDVPPPYTEFQRRKIDQIHHDRIRAKP